MNQSISISEESLSSNKNCSETDVWLYILSLAHFSHDWFYNYFLGSLGWKILCPAPHCRLSGEFQYGVISRLTDFKVSNLNPNPNSNPNPFHRKWGVEWFKKSNSHKNRKDLCFARWNYKDAETCRNLPSLRL